MFQHPNSRLAPYGRRRLVEREGPGELVRVDVKKVARIPEGGGWRTRGEGAPRHPDSGAGVARLHAAVDGCSGAACSELPGGERKETCAGFAARACGFFRGLGVEVERVMTDDGPGYRPRLFNERPESAGIGHKHTRPYSPWQNGKAERMNRTLAQEW